MTIHDSLDKEQQKWVFDGVIIFYTLGIIIGAILVLLIAKPAHASTDSQFFFTGTGNTTQSWTPALPVNKISQVYNATTSNHLLTKLYLGTNGYVTGTVIQSWIYTGGPESTFVAYVVGIATTTTTGGSPCAGSNPKYFEFDFSDYPILLNASTTYYFTFTSPSSTQIDSCVLTGGSPASGRWNNTDASGWVDNGGYHSLKLYGYTPNVNFLYPQNTIITPEFNTWVMSVSSTTGEGTVGVDYGQTSGSYQYTDTCTFASTSSQCFVPSSTSTFLIPKSQLLTHISYATNTWYAKPYYFEPVSQQFIFGSEISFSAIATAPYPTSTVDPSVLALAVVGSSPLIEGNTENCNHPTSSFISDPGSNFAYGFCVAIQFAFQPSNQITGYFKNSWTDLQTRFPFSALFGIANEIEKNATTTTGTYTISMPLLISSSSVVILSSSTLSNAIGTTNKDIWFNLITNVVWLGTGFIIWKMVL